MAEIISHEQNMQGSGGPGPGLSYYLGSKVSNQPLAMEAGAAAQLEAAIRTKAFDDKLSLSLGGAGMSKFAGSPVRSGGYRVTTDGIAIVPVGGLLLDRGAWLGDYGGYMTSYEGLAEQFKKLAKDDAIKSVVLDIDSGGGMAAGLFDLTDALEVLKSKKHVTAIAANLSASAAYAIGCTAHEFFVTRSSTVGSIGVIIIHTSYQQMFDSAGIEPTIIHAGAHKADGNIYQALTHSARSEMSAGVDEIYESFVEHVAKQRGITAQQVRDTQARTYSGNRAVETGLADGVKNFDELLKYVRKGTGKAETSRKKTTSRKKGVRAMSGNQNENVQQPQPAANEKAPAASVPSVPAAAAASVPSVPAAAAAPLAPVAQPAPAAPSASDERSRIKAITGSDEAKGQSALADHLAFDTDMSVDAAKAMLVQASKDKASAGTNEANSQQAGLNNALAQQMADPANSANISPDSGESKKQSFADFAASAPANRKRI
ncbi:MAG: S49 family peptidase [Hyphomicrobiaceae bacterium]|nr:S49 family peptidase [Hyphomicrobiaceae bacterium]